MNFTRSFVEWAFSEKYGLVHISVGGKGMMHFLDEPGSARAGFSKKSLWLKIFSCCVVATKYHGST